jgi:hypothetical protein
MNRFTRVAFVTAITCAAACGSAAEQEAVRFQGTYSGSVSAAVANAGGAPETGTASATFARSGAHDRLEVKANIRRAGDSGFVVEGRAGAGGWQGRGGPLALVVDRDGRISGGGVEKGHRISFGGRLRDGRMDLRVETLQFEGARQRIVFDYQLVRSGARLQEQPARAASADGRGDAKGACKRRVWKTRNVASPGGGMVMTQVPHCVD